MTHRSHLRIGNFNVKRLGYSSDTRFHDFGPLLETLSQAPLPHVLALPEATMVEEFEQEPLWELVGHLNDMWDGHDYYLPFCSHTPHHRNHPLLLVAGHTVRPKKWYKPSPNTRRAYENTLLAEVFGQRVFFQALHWDGGRGPVGFAEQSAVSAQLAAHPAFKIGDFNATSSAPGEILYPDWHERLAAFPMTRAQKGVKGPDGRWVINTEPMDDLLAAGFVDAGQEAQDFTVTVNEGVDAGAELRIDRTLRSRKVRASLVPGSYHVFVPEPGTEPPSDHRYQIATYAFYQ